MSPPGSRTARHVVEVALSRYSRRPRAALARRNDPADLAGHAPARAYSVMVAFCNRFLQPRLSSWALISGGTQQSAEPPADPRHDRWRKPWDSQPLVWWSPNQKPRHHQAHRQPSGATRSRPWDQRGRVLAILGFTGKYRNGAPPLRPKCCSGSGKHVSRDLLIYVLIVAGHVANYIPDPCQVM